MNSYLSPSLPMKPNRRFHSQQQLPPVINQQQQQQQQSMVADQQYSQPLVQQSQCKKNSNLNSEKKCFFFSF